MICIERHRFRLRQRRLFMSMTSDANTVRGNKFRLPLLFGKLLQVFLTVYSSMQAKYTKPFPRPSLVEVLIRHCYFLDCEKATSTDRVEENAATELKNPHNSSPSSERPSEPTLLFSHDMLSLGFVETELICTSSNCALLCVLT